MNFGAHSPYKSPNENESGFLADQAEKLFGKMGSAARDYLLRRFPLPRKHRFPMPLSVATFRAGDETSQSHATTQGIFLSDRLVISASDEKLAEGIAITSIFIGSDSCLVNNNPVTLAIFSAQAVDSLFTFPVSEPGITISLSFHNSKGHSRYAYPVKKLNSKWAKVKIGKRHERCDHHMGPGLQCPHPAHHQPHHDYRPPSLTPPSPQVTLFPVMLGEYLYSNDPRRHSVPYPRIG